MSAAAGQAEWTVTAQVVGAENFSRFGHVLSTEGVDPLPRGLYPGVRVFIPAPIYAETDLQWMLTRTDVREFRLLYLERHHQISQAFIPLGGDPFVSVVAPADAREENGFPALEEICAFIVPGDRGIQIHPGVWHEPPFALVDGSQQLLTSHQRLTRGLRSGLNERGEIAELDVDKRSVAERTGRIVRIGLP